MSNRTPFFQFYPADFLVGSAAMTTEETGAYIRLLCHSWESDGLPNDPEILARLAGCHGNATALPLSKFTKSSDGKLRNARQEETRQKLSEYQARQAENARKGWKTRKGIPQDEDATAMPPQCHGNATALQPKPKPKESLSLPNGREFPCWEQVKAKAEMIGLPEWRAREWFDSMDGVGWVTSTGNPIMRWESTLNTVRSWWQKDGCPKENENNKRSNSKRVDRNRGTLNERAAGEPNPFAGIKNH